MYTKVELQELSEEVVDRSLIAGYANFYSNLVAAARAGRREYFVECKDNGESFVLEQLLGTMQENGFHLDFYEAYSFDNYNLYNVTIGW